MDIDRVLGKQVVSGLLDTITTPLLNWLAAHPLWSWLLTHPLWMLGLILVSILLLSGLLRAISRLTEWLWLAVLRFPVQLIQWLVGGTVQLCGRLLGWKIGWKGSSVEPEQVQQQERLTAILNRLEALKQEQDELLKEARSILTLKELIS